MHGAVEQVARRGVWTCHRFGSECICSDEWKSFDDSPGLRCRMLPACHDSQHANLEMARFEAVCDVTARFSRYKSCNCLW